MRYITIIAMLCGASLVYGPGTASTSQASETPVQTLRRVKVLSFLGGPCELTQVTGAPDAVNIKYKYSESGQSKEIVFEAKEADVKKIVDAYNNVQAQEITADINQLACDLLGPAESSYILRILITRSKAKKSQAQEDAKIIAVHQSKPAAAQPRSTTSAAKK